MNGEDHFVNGVVKLVPEYPLHVLTTETYDISITSSTTER